jgi:GTP-binding protein
VVDGTGEHAGTAYTTVRAELEAYDHGLRDKPEIVALNKTDAMSAEEVRRQVGRLKHAAKTSPLLVSAATGVGVPEVLRALMAIIDQARETTDPRAGVRAPAWQP